jgi:endonuclease/exonuclease/phosphatase family metal-dependent hydrolase
VYGKTGFQYRLGKKDKRGICTAIATNIQGAILGSYDPESITLPVWRTSEEELAHTDMQCHLRGNPWVAVTYMDKKLKIYGVHGKSKFGERLRGANGIHIEGETMPKEDVDGYVRSLLIRAAEMRGLAHELLGGDELQVVIGDFNDSPEGAGTEILLATKKLEEMTRREGVHPYSFVLRDGTSVLPDICLIDKRLAQYVVKFDVFEQLAIPEHSREWGDHAGSDHAPILLTLSG